MIDLTQARGRILNAALELAAENPWREVTLLDIAERAKTGLADVKREFSGKPALISTFIGLVDDTVIRNPPSRDDGESARDRLFEVIMNRFDAMAPYKPALKSIVRHGGLTPLQLQSVLNSQYWMMQAAGISADGPGGGARVAGLLGVYAAVFRIWLDDDDAGLARTMAALDRRLRRGEASLQRIDDACSGLSQTLRRLRSLLRGARAGRKSDGPDTSAEAENGAPPPDADSDETVSV